MSKKEKLLKRYLETHTLADYEAYAACPKNAKDDEPIRRGLKEESDGESSIQSRNKRG